MKRKTKKAEHFCYDKVVVNLRTSSLVIRGAEHGLILSSVQCSRLSLAHPSRFGIEETIQEANHNIAIERPDISNVLFCTGCIFASKSHRREEWTNIQISRKGVTRVLSISRCEPSPRFWIKAGSTICGDSTLWGRLDPSLLGRSLLWRIAIRIGRRRHWSNCRRRTLLLDQVMAWKVRSARRYRSPGCVHRDMVCESILRPFENLQRFLDSRHIDIAKGGSFGTS